MRNSLLPALYPARSPRRQNNPQQANVLDDILARIQASRLGFEMERRFQN